MNAELQAAAEILRRILQDNEKNDRLPADPHYVRQQLLSILKAPAKSSNSHPHSSIKLPSLNTNTLRR
jgi:hypothetical protein